MFTKWFGSRLIQITVGIMLAVLFSGCAQEPTATRNEKAVVYGAVTDPYSFNPIIGADAACTEMQSLMFNTLVKINGQKEVISDLAQSWEVDEQHKKYIFYLNRQVEWHDGHKLTSRDVKFTFDALLDPRNAVVTAGDFQNIAAVRVIDDYTLEFSLQEPEASFLAKLATVFIIPDHLLGEETNLKESQFNNHPVGTGPFKFAERKKANYIKFIANERYYKGRPQLDTFYYRVIPDSSVLALQLAKGEIDVAQIEAREYDFLKQTPTVKLISMPGQAYTYIALNNRRPLFADQRVRRAMAMGHDRHAVIQHILNGHASLAVADLPPVSWGFNPALPPVEYDPAAAAGLLEEAGWQKNQQGILTKNGQVFSFILMISNGNKKINDLALAFRQDMQRLGIDVQVMPLEFNVLRQKLLTGQYDACFMSQRLSPDPDTRYSAWCSGQIDGGINLTGYSNSRVNDLFRAGRQLSDQAQRQAIYQEVQRILRDDQPCIFHSYPELIIGFRDNITGILPQGAGAKDNIFWNIEEWSTREANK